MMTRSFAFIINQANILSILDNLKDVKEPKKFNIYCNVLDSSV